MQSRRRQTGPQRRRVNGRRFGLKRVFTVATIALASAMVLYLFFATGSAALTREWARDRLVNLAANAGYRVKNLYVEGRHYTDADIVRGVINMDKGDPLFAFDPETARDLLMKVSWVKNVNVRREMPDSIYINITERQPLALWQTEGKVRVIDAEGVVLTSDLRAFTTLPLVVGVGANTRAVDLLAQLAAEPELQKRVTTAAWVGDRRWDLTTTTGMVIKLPEEDMGLALKKLADGQKQDKLLEKDIAVIDLREADRLVVRTKPGAVTEYKASFHPGEKEL